MSPLSSKALASLKVRIAESAVSPALFAKAADTTDPVQKRALLDQIARATTVDSIRRKRAANELAAEGAASVDVSDLPSAPKEPAHLAQQTAPRPASVATDDPSPESKPATKVSTPATLVRKNPFDEGTDSSGDATDRAKLLQAKATLQQKAQSGQASDRDLKMLHAVCRQLGDASCSN